MNASGLINFLNYIITPYTGSDNVFNKINGETLDSINKQINELLVIGESGWVIYNDLNEINFPANGTITAIAKLMKQKSILTAIIESSTPIANLPRNNGILMVIKLSHTRTAFFMLTPVGFFYTYINYNESPYINWIQLTPSKDNNLLGYGDVLTPNYQGVKATSLHMVNNANTIVFSGSFTLNADLAGSSNLTVVTNLSVKYTPKQTLNIVIPYVISGSNIIPVRLEINTSGQIILHNLSTTTIPQGYSIPVAISYVTRDS